MTVNHGVTLKKEYFLSYLNLVISFRHCSVIEAKDLAFQLFFKNDKDAFGDETYSNFLEAVTELRNSELPC